MPFSPERPPLVATRGLTKKYRHVTALADCSFEVQPGEIFGLLGPNGAGKTTLLRLLMGYLRPTAGEAAIGGLDCLRDSVKVRRTVAYLPGEVRLFRTMRGRDILRFFAEIRPGGDYQASMALARRMDLDVSRRVAYMSTGMRQKLALAATMATRTALVILDEPTSNLDPTMRGIVLELVAEAKRAGRTVMFSSHVLSEVEEVCDRVIILRAGRLVHTQALAELRRQHRIRAWLTGGLPEPPERFRGQLDIRPGRDSEVIIETPGELAPLLGWLSTLPLTELLIEPVGLRAIYDRFHAE
jgi:ABC-2 type transport system ATP-binding protein